MFDKLLAILAPHQCLHCGEEGALWCAVCRSAAPPMIERCYKCHRLAASGRTCGGCRRGGLYGVRAVTRYEGLAKTFVWKMKFDGVRSGAGIAGDMIADAFTLPTSAIVMHVPTATGRVRRRGYDQAHLIARRLAGRTGLPFRPLLVRFGQAQQHNAARQQRITQLQGAFRVRRPELVRGAHIILVDDVITTGATLEAAAKALRTAGARRVEAFVFAQA